jgi:Transglycosylase SLT domain
MANIPLVQIPNAPQTGSTAVPLPVGAIRTPDVELMGMIDDASYMAVGRAYENLGNAGQQAANVLGDFSLSMARASDEANLAKADSIKTDMVAKFDAEVATKPESEWNAIWENNYAPKLRDQVSSLKMTTRDGLNRRDTWLANTENGIKAQVFTSANKAMIGRATQEQKNYIERAKVEGRWEDAMAGWRRGAEVGLWTGEYAESEIIGIEEEQRVNTMTNVIQQNPAQWRKELAKYQKEGKNPHKLRPEQVLQFRRMAEGTHAQLLDDLNNEMLTRLETESAAITNEDIEKFYTRPDIDAPRELINKMKEYRDFKYADTPEGQAEQATKFSDLWQKIFSYNAEKDISMADPDTHKREYQRLISEIVTTAPEGQRKPFMDTLDKMVSDANQGKKSRADEITKGLTDLTGKLASWGQLGNDGGWKEVKIDGKVERVPKDPNMQLQVQTKRLEITNDIRALLRENPDLTEEQAMERFKGILENRLEGGALFMQQPDEESWWQKLIPFVMGPDLGPNVMTAGLGFRGFGGSPMDGLQDADEPLPPVQNMPPTGDFNVANLPPAKQPIAGQIASMAEAEGLGQYTPHLMLLVAQESNFNPDQTISTSSARGLFQLLNADRKRFGGDSSLDGQIRAGLAKTKENINAARRALGRDPDPFELYVVHYQGISAGPAILKNPDGDFRQTLDATGGKGHAARVIRANKWLADIQTNQDFMDWVRERLSKKAAALGMA